MGTVSVDAKMRAFPFRGATVPTEEIPPGHDPRCTPSHFSHDGELWDEEALYDTDLEELDRMLCEEFGDTLDMIQ